MGQRGRAWLHFRDRRGEPQLKEKQNFTYTADNRDGYLLSRWGAATQVARDGSVTDVYTSKVADPETRLASWDFKDFYFPVPRQGISRATYNGNYDWTPGTLYKVNAPQPTGVFGFAYSDLAGMLAGNETHNRIYSYADNRRYPGLVSGYDRGSWTPYGVGSGIRITPGRIHVCHLRPRGGSGCAPNISGSAAGMQAFSVWICVTIP